MTVWKETQRYRTRPGGLPEFGGSAERAHPGESTLGKSTVFRFTQPLVSEHNTTSTSDSQLGGLVIYWVGFRPGLRLGLGVRQEPKEMVLGELSC